MRTLSFSLVLLCFFNILSAQPALLILTGKIENYSGKEIYLKLKTRSGVNLLDTILLKNDGSFSYKTDKCLFPQISFFGGLGFGIPNFQVAPGYEMNITCDAKDFRTLLTTIKITGTGSCVNQYDRKLEKLYLSGKDSTGYWASLNIDTSWMIPRITKNKITRDSLLKETYDHCTEPYAAYFRYLSHCTDLYLLYSYFFLMAEYNRFDDSTYFGFINRHIPIRTIADLPDDEYPVPDNYLSFIGQYLDYLKQQSIRQHKNPIEDDFMAKAIAGLKGKAREAVFFDRFLHTIKYAKTMDELSSTEKVFQPYLDQYISAEKRKILRALYDAKIDYFNVVKVNQPAPAFTLSDDKGITHSLSDFKGKLVYIDFWGSWCGPCREETPFFKTLFQKYKNDDRIVLLSIDVYDKKEDWLEALRHDGMNWLQLRDDKGNLKDDYNTGSIPRFVLIDKQGKIVSLDAPRPSNTAELNKILEKQLAL